MKGCGVYKIENPYKEVYIGSSFRLEARKACYFSNYKNGKSSRPIDASILFHGFEKHTFTVIELCGRNELDERERFYIKEMLNNKVKVLNVKNNCYAATKYKPFSINRVGLPKSACKSLFHERERRRVSISYVSVATGIPSINIYDIESRSTGTIMDLFSLSQYYGLTLILTKE